ncbi:thiamine pyrophosphate-binding protein [Sulfolobus acidocaldarius]|uniref:2-oxoacid oxidoreductase (ferredoxin) n=4 Tax=Sulfolobus acidocaldarius TaxID=2285 RepID=Q4J9P1_SULAC|nr:thiamine pyrophosphate-binding protein [Sulfolobus acidocaldarius]AAY80489.1 thiamine pyrophosphate enzyme [Sulfolobus acidocaldarius DSM 639]AGE71073.1 thiamine pyrophosphate enzyme [Sulfolobus acidocaldarius N8]AGE73344.1 thiamine pyrophosphate enzyme [Sulfolobus acidocaldarius Ron12/I]ALU28646.1 thiamine pyrophosphate-binding protein [Sulfolobus acidocaldarius]ALU31362.1 thiamine pyrophosphate-binding protein [Sulfolobus acidocaldarius]
MKASKSLLELLDKYNVKHVFGLVGETSFPLYDAFNDYPNITHVFARDERNAVIMADAYARFSYKPGIVEVPNVGAPYTLPGLAEANISGIPIIMFVSDIPTYVEKRNMLTEHDNSYLNKLSKEFLSVNDPSQLPRVVRRAFRVATTGRTGPVVVKIPMNIYDGEVSDEEVYSQPEFSVYPSLRFMPDPERITEALKILYSAKNPVIVCGQGVLLSNASEEVVKLAEALSIPVATTITGKGSFPETHPLSIGVIGARGGTRFSNKILAEADVVFLIGTNTDSANTWDWRLPSSKSTIIQLDVSERELGNNYKVIPLLGDAKLTLKEMIRMIREVKRNQSISEIEREKRGFEQFVESLANEKTELTNPVRFMKILSEFVDEKTFLVVDPGTGAIFSSAYLKLKLAGRRIMYNYSMGGLGYALPALIGAYFATGGRILSITTDGNLFFNLGELETVKRLNVNAKIFVFNNKSFGWIRAAMLSKYGRVLSGTEISEIDYSKLASSFGIDYLRIEKSEEIESVTKEALVDDSPKFIEVLVKSEDKVIPPVPDWREIKDGKFMG